MKAFLKKAAFFGLIVGVYFSATSLYNFTIDPYGIFGNRREFYGIRPNEHSLKVNHVLENPNKFNSFLFSNSKGGMIHVNRLEDGDLNWYNMTYSLGTPEEFYKDLLLFEKSNVKIKRLIIGLDEGAIYERTSSHENQASRKFVDLQADKIQWEFLFLPISFEKILGMDLTKKHMVHDIYNDGNYFAKNAHPENCGKEEILKFLDIPQTDNSQPLNFSSQIEILQKIRQFCQKKNIDLTFLIHPSSLDNFENSTEKAIQFGFLINTLEREEFDLFVPYKSKLLVNNDCYWVDKYHYSEHLGNRILKMYNDNYLTMEGKE